MTHVPPSRAQGTDRTLSDSSTGDCAPADAACVLAERVSALEAAFSRIAQERMAGVAMLHPRVRVQATPFVALDAQSSVGILITPWFMNLLWLPILRSDECQIGSKTTRHIGEYAVELTTAFEPAVGGFEVCSIYSPLTLFEDHAAVYETAQTIMRTLLSASPSSSQVTLGRREMLFGRGSRERRAATHSPGKAR